jgi:hypothetical protein
VIQPTGHEARIYTPCATSGIDPAAKILYPHVAQSSLANEEYREQKRSESYCNHDGTKSGARARLQCVDDGEANPTRHGAGSSAEEEDFGS